MTKLLKRSLVNYRKSEIEHLKGEYLKIGIELLISRQCNGNMTTYVAENSATEEKITTSCKTTPFEAIDYLLQSLNKDLQQRKNTVGKTVFASEPAVTS